MTGMEVAIVVVCILFAVAMLAAIIARQRQIPAGYCTGR